MRMITDDLLLLHTDLLVITETWMDTEAPSKKNFSWFFQYHAIDELVVWLCTSEMTAISTQIVLTASHQVKLNAISYVRDIIVIQIKLHDEPIFILAMSYVRQRVPYKNLLRFLTNWLLQ